MTDYERGWKDGQEDRHANVRYTSKANEKSDYGLGYRYGWDSADADRRVIR